MNTVSISQLKVNPSRILGYADDYPVAISKQNKIEAYVIGKVLYESLLSYIEDQIDRKAVEETDFSQGEDFEEVAKELGI